jgi:hypothetical protein
MSPDQDAPMSAVVVLDAGHDRNGNPRRILWHPRTGRTADEGYEGDGPRRLCETFGLAHAEVVHRAPITATEYRGILKAGPA